jgi:hypothetical protein
VAARWEGGGMRDSAPTLGLDRASRRGLIRDESHREAGSSRGKGGTDAGGWADCVLLYTQPGFIPRAVAAGSLGLVGGVLLLA